MSICASSTPRRLRGGRSGAALVVVLAFIVLLSGVVLAFFAQAMSERMVSNSSASQTKAEILAQGALDQIVGDLKQEIADGSTVTMVGTTTIYTPKSNTNAAPQLAGSSGTDGLEALLKRSSSTNAFYPGGSTRAAALSTTGASRNGRSISPARWNKPLLLPKSTNSATDYTPVLTSGTFAAPDWIYVARDGSNPTAWNTNMIPSGTNPTAVVGRYAYNIYDESGLLDVNVAGYPIGSGVPPYTGANSDPGASYKGVLAFADLTQLPGISAMTPAKQKTIINSLVGWRNYASAKPAGALTNGYDFTGSPLTNFTTAIRANTNGFLTTGNTNLFNGASDRMFGSRQELIRFLLQSVGTSIDTIKLQTALQYLGTFSRALNAPSWTPTANSADLPGYQSGGGTTPVAYKDNADKATSANRNIPNVRFANNATITHYKDDGTTTSYEVQAGDPLVQRRFSLAKLAWLHHDGPKAGIPSAAIRACFGLQWNNARWRWDYVAGKNPPGVRIKTLDEVAQEGREPNFFELLNAGILSGSLGRDPGPGVDVYDPAVGLGVYASLYDTYKADKDLHVMQIGANIIDQFDSDSYPTAIYFDVFDFTASPIDDLAINTVYGTENLPGLHALTAVILADPVPPSRDGSLPANAALKFWLQPALWNPHQVPAVALDSLPNQYPSGFRGYAYGKAYGMWQKSGSPTFFTANKTEYDDGTGNAATPGQPGEFYFSNPADGTSPFYTRPKLMTLDLVSTSGAQIVNVASTPADNYYDPTKWDALPGDQVPPNQFVGFSLLPYQNYATTTLSPWIVPDVIYPLYVSLQYRGTDGNYHPYCFMARIAQSSHVSSKLLRPADLSSKVYGRTLSVQGWGGLRVDPRTDRFSESAQWFGQVALNTLDTGPNGFSTIAGSGNGGTGGFGTPISSAFTYVPTYIPMVTPGPYIAQWSMNDPAFHYGGFNSQAYYADPDGVVRYGDNYRRNDKTGDGCQLYLGTAAVTGPGSTLTTPKSVSVPPGSAQARRPAILNRAFRSVGELGYAYRDLPFKSLDLWSPTSGDGGLLDLFAVNDTPLVTAGQINVNNAPAAVLQAVIAGGSKSEVLADAPNGVQISTADASLLAGKIAADILANGPYWNRADLAARLGPVVSDPNYGRAFDTTLNTATQPYSNWANKSYAEAPMRALADVTNTRTWNLLVDVIAQTGMFAPNSTSLSGFIVQGERRYWLHVAIDRFTGKIVDQQLEPVYE